MLALLVRAAFDTFLGDAHPVSFFLAAAAMAAWCGGLGPALLALVLGYLAADWFFIPPRRGFGEISLLSAFSLATYAITGLIISVTVTSAQRAVRRERLTAAQMQQEHARFRVTLSSIGDAVIATDHQGLISFMNPIAEKVTGWTQQEAQGQPLRKIFDIHNELTGQPVEDPVAKVLQTGAIIGLANHTVLISKIGREIPIDDSAAPIRDPEGNLVGTILVFRDVTEQRRAELATRRLAAIVESSDDAIIGKDLNGIITSWNRGAERMFGYSTAEIMGKSITVLIPSDYQKEEQHILECLRRGEHVDHLETIRKTKEGRPIHVSLSSSPIKDSEGHIIGASKIARDITDRKRFEQALRENEERFRALVNASAQTVWTTDAQGKMIEESSTWRHFTGQTWEEWKEQGWLGAIHPEDRDQVAASWQKAISEKRTFSTEYRLRHVSGEWRWTNVRAVPIFHSDGSVHGWVGMNMDVTERKQSESLLAERGRLNALRADIATTLVQKGDLPSILQECAELFVRSLGVAFARIWLLNERENVLELKASAGIYTHLDGSHSQIQMGAFKIGCIAQNRQPHLTNDVAHDSQISHPEWAKDERMVAFAGYPLIVEGRVLGVMAMFSREPFSEDVFRELKPLSDTIGLGIERKRADEALASAQEQLAKHAESLEQQVIERTAKLQEIVDSLDAFCYSIAHDLRAPLRSIHSFTNILQQDYAQVFDAQGQDYAQRIMASASRMDRLINDLLAYGRLTHVELLSEVVDLETLVQRTIKELAHDIDLSKAVVELKPPLPPARANPTLLEQILHNLLSNALKFVQPGIAPKVTISARLEKKAVRFQIQDNGIGIPKEHRAKIFRVFERLHTDDKYPGTGIGLAIVKKGVERMGGMVGVESEAGQGSCFWVELPSA